MSTGESVGVKNLALRVGFALSIVLAALGMTALASTNKAAPLAADRVAASSPSNSSPQDAVTLVALATTLVLLAIFVILFSYRPRPGGVRASGR
jgi:hypothetical protein